MDEVSSSGPLDCPRSRASPIKRLFHLFFESHTGRAAVPIPKRSASPRVISTPQWWIGLKALDQNRPIREGTIGKGKWPVPGPGPSTKKNILPTRTNRVQWLSSVGEKTRGVSTASSACRVAGLSNPDHKEHKHMSAALRLVEGSAMDKSKALDAALSQIERNFGKGSIMRLGKNAGSLDIETVSTGSPGADIGPGGGGLP